MIILISILEMFYQNSCRIQEHQLKPFTTSSNRPDPSSLDMEENCLIRLKQQRLKIEELSKLYHQKDKQLIEKQKIVQGFKKQNDELQKNVIFKRSYQQLKSQFEDLFAQYQLALYEIRELKGQLGDVITTSSQQIYQLKVLIKNERESKSADSLQWEQIIAGKEEKLKQVQKTADQREHQLNHKVRKLQQENTQLRQQNNESENLNQQLRIQIKNQNKEIRELQLAMDETKRQVSLLKHQIISKQRQFDQQRYQYQESIEQYRKRIEILKRQEKHCNDFHRYQQGSKQTEIKVISLEEDIGKLRKTIDKLQNHRETSTAKKQTKDNQKQKLEQKIQRQERQIKRSVEQYNLLAIECKKLRAMVERKQTKSQYHEGMFSQKEVRER